MAYTPTPQTQEQVVNTALELLATQEAQGTAPWVSPRQIWSSLPSSGDTFWLRETHIVDILKAHPSFRSKFDERQVLFTLK